MKRADVLDRNLRALLRKAYRPVRPGAAFRRELRARVLRPYTEPGEVESAGTISRPARRTAASRWAAAAAAALLLGAGAVAFFVARAPAGPGREDLLAAGLVALRDAAVGDWSAADGERTWLPRGSFLQVATPATTGHTVDVERTGRFVVLAGSDLSIRTTTDAAVGAPAVVAHLSGGGVDASHSGAEESWTVDGPGGAVSLRGGRVVLAAEGADESTVAITGGPVTWIGAAGATVELPDDSRWRLRRGERPVREDEAEPPSAHRPEKEVVAETAPRGPSAPTSAPEEPTASGAAPSVTGTVVDAATDLPVPRFEVAIVAVMIGGQPAYGRDAESARHEDESGAFVLRGLEEGSYRLFVTADGYATWRSPLVVVGGAPAAVTARLERGGAISGRVVDAATGRPVEGVTVFSQTDVAALLVPIDLAQLERPLAPEGRMAVSDADGRFVLRSLSPGAQRLRASRPGSAPAWTDVPELRSGENRGGVELSLSPGGGVRGHARLGDGTPLAQVPIIAMPLDSQAGTHGAPYGVGVTDDDGAYAIGDLPAGMHVLVLLSELEPEDLDSVRTVQPCRVGAAAWTTVDFGGERPGGTRVTGRLLDSAGAPVSATMVTLSLGETLGDGTEDWVTSTTDEEGRFAFDGVGEGRHLLYLTDASGSRVEEIDTIDVPPVPEHHVEIRLPGGTIEGRVVDGRTGAPEPFSLVLLVPDDGRSDDSIAAKVTSDAEGVFRLRFVAAGPYRLRALPAAEELGAVDVGVHVDPGGTVEGLELRAAPGATIDVTVVDAGHAPVEGAALRLFDSTGRPFATAWNPVTGAAGHRRLGQIPPGTWRLEVVRGATRSSHTLVVGAGDHARVTVDLPLPSHPPRPEPPTEGG